MTREESITLLQAALRFWDTVGPEYPNHGNRLLGLWIDTGLGFVRLTWEKDRDVGQDYVTISALRALPVPD